MHKQTNRAMKALIYRKENWLIFEEEEKQGKLFL